MIANGTFRKFIDFLSRDTIIALPLMGILILHFYNRIRLKINLIIKYRQKAQLVIGNNGLIRIGIFDFVGCPGQVQDILGTENIDQVKRYFMA